MSSHLYISYRFNISTTIPFPFPFYFIRASIKISSRNTITCWVEGTELEAVVGFMVARMRSQRTYPSNGKNICVCACSVWFSETTMEHLRKTRTKRKQTTKLWLVTLWSPPLETFLDLLCITFGRYKSCRQNQVIKSLIPKAQGRKQFRNWTTFLVLYINISN